jgi:hypothetical protein
VFWKLICRESPLVFFLKVFLVGAGASCDAIFHSAARNLSLAPENKIKSGGQMTRRHSVLDSIISGGNKRKIDSANSKTKLQKELKKYVSKCFDFR